MVVNNRKRILLIEPPFYRLYKPEYGMARYPLGLGYLAAEIQTKTDWDVKVYNADYSGKTEQIKISFLTREGFDNYRAALANQNGEPWNEIKDVIAAVRPEMVGLSAKSQNFASCLNVARKVKEIQRDITVVVGGPHPTLVGAEALDNPWIDIAVRGEGEETMVELLTWQQGNNLLSKIKGIIYKENGKIRENPLRPLISDLDRLGYPNHTAPGALLEYDRYPPEAFRYMFLSRGCPYNCFFCASRNIWTRKVRMRSVNDIIDEIKILQAQGHRYLQFDDDTLGINRKYTIELCTALEKRLPDLEWACNLHANVVDEELMNRMKRAGCRLVMLGVESGHNEMLKKIRKTITIEQAYEAARIIKANGIELYTYFMVGFPEETEETLAATMEAMKTIECDFLVYSIFTPYPGTESYGYCREKGQIGDDFDVSLYNHQSPANNFCLHIPPVRFRQLAAEIEKIVDRKNTLSGFRKLERKQDKTDYEIYRIASGYKRYGLLNVSRQWFQWLADNSLEAEIQAGVYFHLGEINLTENRTETARKCFEICLEKNPGHKRAAEYRQQIKKRDQ
jgi:anaerobic magnesium-protoporphyrin IX monomethyl ester cyclase